MVCPAYWVAELRAMLRLGVGTGRRILRAYHAFRCLLIS